MSGDPARFFFRLLPEQVFSSCALYYFLVENSCSRQWHLPRRQRRRKLLYTACLCSFFYQSDHRGCTLLDYFHWFSSGLLSLKFRIENITRGWDKTQLMIPSLNWNIKIVFYKVLFHSLKLKLWIFSWADKEKITIIVVADFISAFRLTFQSFSSHSQPFLPLWQRSAGNENPVEKGPFARPPSISFSFSKSSSSQS